MTINTMLPANCHEMTRIVAEYWTSIHPGPGLLPGREHFDPLDLSPTVWPFLVLSEIIIEPFDLRYRLVGTEVVALDGFDSTGMTFSECPARRDREATLADYRKAIETRSIHFRRMPLHDTVRGYELTIERAHFPLARNGQDVDMFLTSIVRLDRKRLESEPFLSPCANQ